MPPATSTVPPRTRQPFSFGSAPGSGEPAGATAVLVEDFAGFPSRVRFRPIASQKLAALNLLVTMDNFEGVAARRMPEHGPLRLSFKPGEIVTGKFSIKAQDAARAGTNIEAGVLGLCQ